jgi:replicative DNA helicase
MPVDLILEKGLPHSLDAERAVLCSLILENQSIYEILDLLAAEDFYGENHKILYQRMIDFITTAHAVIC